MLQGQVDETPTFRTSVAVVKVDTKVTGRDGRSINDLTKDDFLVFDEDSPRPILDFGRESVTEPLRLLLLLDVSGSMSRLLGEMSAKAAEALRPLHSGDQVGVMVFATNTELVLPFTSETNRVSSAIVDNVYKATRGRSTFTNEALLAAASYMNKQPAAGRRAVLIVTDNEGARISAQDSAVLRALHEADIVLNAIIVGAMKKRLVPGRYSDPASMPPDVYRFVENTGGDVIADEDAAGALGRIVRQIATRYSFDYSAPQAEPGAYRRIRVELTPAAQRKYPGAMVQARTGYYMEKQ
jgi:VWFA-related protein